MDSPFVFLSQFAIQAPLLVIWLVGMLLALLWWQRAPKVAAVTCVACALFLVDTLIGTLIVVALPGMLIERGQSTSQVAVAFTVIGICRALLHAVLWSAVLFAIFSGRSPVPAKQVDDHDSRA